MTHYAAAQERLAKLVPMTWHMEKVATELELAYVQVRTAELSAEMAESYPHIQKAEADLRELEERLQRLRAEQGDYGTERSDMLSAWRQKSPRYLKLLEGPEMGGVLAFLARGAPRG